MSHFLISDQNRQSVFCGLHFSPSYQTHIQQVITLDTDMLLNHDISELWNLFEKFNNDQVSNHKIQKYFANHLFSSCLPQMQTNVRLLNHLYLVSQLHFKFQVLGFALEQQPNNADCRDGISNRMQVRYRSYHSNYTTPSRVISDICHN